MQCPSCNVAFHPQFTSTSLGRNAKKVYGYLYHQTCPSCEEFIVAIKQSDELTKVWLLPTIDDGQTKIIHPQKSR